MYVCVCVFSCLSTYQRAFIYYITGVLWFALMCCGLPSCGVGCCGVPCGVVPSCGVGCCGVPCGVVYCGLSL